MKKIHLLLFLMFSITAIGQQQLTNIPTFYINTINGEPVLDKNNYVKAELTILSSDVSENFSDDVKIRGRGNSTWGMPKKPYRIKLLEKTRLLNQKAKAKSWVLLANYADKTLMRNAVAFKISDIIGLEFTPSVRFVDVVLNGEYLGNYMMSDQVQVASGRVEVEKQEVDDITEPNITGGYLLEIDGFANYEPVFFKTNKGIKITIKYPKDDDINDEQRNYISNYANEFENVLFSSNFKDPENGYRAYVDTTTLINWYIACELTGNSDSFWSTYIYKKRNNPKFYFGPLWDYDIAFNNDYRLGDATTKLMREYAHKDKTWIKRFWEDPWFQKAVNRRWKELVDNGIEQQLIEYITNTQTLINQSQQLNYEKWKILNKVVYREVFTFPTYEEGVEYLKTYIRKRIAFLNKGFIKSEIEEPYENFEFENGAYYMIINKKSNNAVDVSDEVTANGTKLMFWQPDKGKLTQHWKFQKDNNNNFVIINRATSEAIKAIGSLGANIVSDKFTDSDNFKWKVLSTNTENYHGIVGYSFGYVFNNSGGNLSNGTPLIEWNSNLNKSNNAKFRFEKIITSHFKKLKNKNLNIYFNSSNKTIDIKLNDTFDNYLKVEIYSLNGLQIMNVNLFASKACVDISSLSKGIYIIKLITNKGVYSEKFINVF